MRKILTVTAIAITMALWVSGSAWSQQPGKQPSAKESMPSVKPEGKQIVGEVVKVDGKANIVVVKTPSGEKKFDVTNAGLAGYDAIGDIKPGDKIAVLYEEKDGKLIAKAVANHSAMMKMHKPTK
jgi:hypothetical protein